ncbi:hypothetical protein B0H34DRAFT_720614 [Crassisporium funariophilum]|nr:hypothetical protein B0H34DRAFT_720614 [Crassisporium funariophilum]
MAVRDVSEAFRTVPLHYSQWPAAVVCVDDDAFCVDTFGASALVLLGASMVSSKTLLCLRRALVWKHFQIMKLISFVCRPCRDEWRLRVQDGF